MHQENSVFFINRNQMRAKDELVSHYHILEYSQCHKMAMIGLKFEHNNLYNLKTGRSTEVFTVPTIRKTFANTIPPFMLFSLKFKSTLHTLEHLSYQRLSRLCKLPHLSPSNIAFQWPSWWNTNTLIIYYVLFI